MRTTSKYCWIRDEKSFCPVCEQKVILLAPFVISSRRPSFYICITCHWIGQVGVGEVQELKA